MPFLFKHLFLCCDTVVYLNFNRILRCILQSIETAQKAAPFGAALIIISFSME